MSAENPDREPADAPAADADTTPAAADAAAGPAAEIEVDELAKAIVERDQAVKDLGYAKADHANDLRKFKIRQAEAVENTTASIVAKFLDVADELRLIGDGHQVEFEEGGGRGEVDVRVDEARQHEAAAEVNDPRGRAAVPQDGLVAADGQEPAVLHGHGPGGGVRVVHRPDGGVVKDQVGRLPGRPRPAPEHQGEGQNRSDDP